MVDLLDLDAPADYDMWAVNITADELARPAADLLAAAEEADRNAQTADQEADRWRAVVAQEERAMAHLEADRRRAHRKATRTDRPNSHHTGREELRKITEERMPRQQAAIDDAAANVDHHTRDAARLRAVADTYRTAATTQTTPAQEAPTMRITDFPTHYTATGPDGRPLTRNTEVSENRRIASFIRVASATEILVEWDYLNQREIITADRMGVKITAHGPREPREILSTDHRRCEHRKNVTADHAPACPVYDDGLTAEHCTCHYSDARCEEQQQTATPITVEWTHTLKGHHNGTATINGRTYRITHLGNADRTRGALGDHLAHLPSSDGRMGTLVARTWGLADLLGALADHADAAPGPLALTETGRDRLTRR